MLRIEFQLGLVGLTSRLFETGDAVRSIEIDNALPIAGNTAFLFLTIRAADDIAENDLAPALSGVDIVNMTPAKVSDHTYYLGVIADLSDVAVLSLLTENEAIPHRIVGKNAHIEVVASVRDWSHLKKVAGAVEDEYGSLELVGTTQTTHIGFPLGSDKIKRSMSGKLSDQQLVVLETAYQMGYFKVPQEVTAEEIANELDISRSTLSERLRRVQHNFCKLLFGPQK